MKEDFLSTINSWKKGVNNKTKNVTTTGELVGKDVLDKGKNLLNIQKDEEISAIKTDLEDLKPVTKNTIQTLMNNSKLRRKIEFNPQDNLCAKITRFSYSVPEERPYQIEEFYLEPKYNNIFHCVYLNHQEKICIIGYRGTEVKTKEDLYSDAQIILGINAIDPRVSGSLQLFDKIRKAYPDYKKWVCGHSLGGTLCYIVAKHRKVDYCCTFNPGSAPNKIFIIMLTDTLQKKEWTQKVHTYKILGDPISTCSFVGKTTNFFIPNWNLLDLHRMVNFVDEDTRKKRTKEEKSQS